MKANQSHAHYKIKLKPYALYMFNKSYIFSKQLSLLIHSFVYYFKVWDRRQLNLTAPVGHLPAPQQMASGDIVLIALEV